MCGIVGVLSDEGFIKSKERKDFFVQGLYVDALRGWDSTGFFLAPRREENDLIIKKRAYQACDFLDLGSVQNSLRDFGNYKAAIGHNRAATVGKVTHKTAHPFNHGDITLVHNGTLNTTIGLPEQHLFAVDSEVIANAFDKESPEDIIPELQGAFALIWHNRKDGTISIARNDERPLSFATVKDEKTVLLASEYRMLDWLASRNKMICENIFTLSKGKILTFDKEDPTVYETKKVKLYQKKFYQKPYNNNSSNKGFNTPDSLLKRLGLKMGEIIDVDPLGFTCYNNTGNGPKWGYLHGKKGNTRYKNELRISQLKEDEWSWAAPDKDLNIPSTKLSAKINSACLGANGGVIVYLGSPEMSPSNYEGDEGDAIEQIEVDKKKVLSKEIAEILISGPGGNKVNSKEWDLLTSKGCVVCQDNIDLKDADKTAWTGDSQPMCYKCVQDGGWEQYIQQ